MLSKLKAYFRKHALLTVNNAYGEAMAIYLKHHSENRAKAGKLTNEMLFLLREAFIRFAQERLRGKDHPNSDFPKSTKPKKL
jgi:hypothetical protein